MEGLVVAAAAAWGQLALRLVVAAVRLRRRSSKRCKEESAGKKRWRRKGKAEEVSDEGLPTMRQGTLKGVEALRQVEVKEAARR